MSFDKYLKYKIKYYNLKHKGGKRRIIIIIKRINS